MTIKSQRDFWAGLLFIVVGVGFAWGATNYGFGTSARPFTFEQSVPEL